jgi:hypothetical protein
LRGQGCHSSQLERLNPCLGFQLPFVLLYFSLSHVCTYEWRVYFPESKCQPRIQPVTVSVHEDLSSPARTISHSFAVAPYSSVFRAGRSR